MNFYFNLPKNNINFYQCLIFLPFRVKYSQTNRDRISMYLMNPDLFLMVFNCTFDNVTVLTPP